MVAAGKGTGAARHDGSTIKTVQLCLCSTNKKLTAISGGERQNGNLIVVAIHQNGSVSSFVGPFRSIRREDS